MIPRYRPAFPSFAARAGEASRWRERVLARLAGGGAAWHERAFTELRHGLYAYFAQLNRTGGRDAVLMSAQVCPVVALAARAAGLRPRFVDIGACSPAPESAQFSAALDERTAAVVVAPFYGHLGKGWGGVAQNLNGARLVLDLAQGIGLGERVAPLLARADAFGFSFGLGKGVDTGGALLLTREPLSGPRGERRAGGSALRAAALWLLAASGLYALVPEAALEAGAAADRFEPRADAGAAALDYARWGPALEEFLSAVEVARTRARELAASGAAARVECADVCFDPGATHLRQLVRVPGRTARDALLAALRRGGIDCAPAGERLPHEYLEGAPPGEAFPNAVRFKAESIRLPFLGRLGDAEFARLRAALETGLGRLPH